MDCLNKEDIINNGGEVIENDNGTVSVYQSDGNILINTPLTKFCCELLDPTYTWDANKQQCKWGIGCDNTSPFKVVLNPTGNDGVIFAVDQNNEETCTLDISFDYLFQMNCNDIISKINEVNNGETAILINELQLQYDYCVTEVTRYQEELNQLILDLESTPYVIICDKTDKTDPNEFEKKQIVFNPNTPIIDKLSVNFQPPNAILLLGLNQLCLTDAGLQQWQNILGPVRYQTWIISNGTDTNQYSCADVATLDTIDNGTGVLFGTCNINITARQEIISRIEELRQLLNGFNCDEILSQINELNIPCSTVSEILESLDVSMTLELVNPDTGILDTIYEEQIFNIGTGNIATYLTTNKPNTGILFSCDTTNENCSIIGRLLMSELAQQLPTSATTEIQDLVQNSFNSEWLNFQTSITDQDILDLIYNEKIKISFKIINCCVDFAILVDRIKMNRNCSKVDSVALSFTKSPSFDMVRTIDNKKSWITNEDFEYREFDLKFRETEYDINNYKLAINSKEVDLDINPANAIEQDLFCYVRDNPCILTGTTSSGTCGDNEIDITELLSTDITEITTLNDFKKILTTELIDSKGWRTTTSYPTLRLLYDRYINSTDYCDTLSSQFNYRDMIKFSELVGTYWVDLIEQVIPSTTIWGSTYVYGNTIFDQQKFTYKKYSLFGCELPTYSGDVVSPTSGWTNSVQIEWEILPNDIVVTGDTTTGTTETTSPFANISYNGCNPNGQEPSTTPTLDTCIGVGIIQINCGSEFMGRIFNYGESSHNGDGIVISEDVENCMNVSIDLTQTSLGVYNANASVGGNVIGTISYLWSDGQTTQMAIGLTAGTYTVTVTDESVESCTANASITIDPLKTCLYTLHETPQWLLLEASFTGYTGTTTIMNSLIVNDVEYITSGSEPVDIMTTGNTNWILANNNVVSGTTTGLTYTNSVDFINNTLDSYGIIDFRAQISTANTTTSLAYGDEFAAFYIINSPNTTFSIDLYSPSAGWTRRYTESNIYDVVGINLVPNPNYLPIDCVTNYPIVNSIVIE